MQPFEFLLGFPVVAWVLNRLPVRVSIKNFQPHVYTDHAPRSIMFYLAGSIDAELDVVAISTMHHPHPFDLLDRKGFTMLLGIADKPELTNAAAIREGDVFPIRLSLPPCLLVLDASVIVLECGIAFLAWLVVLAVLIEAGNSEPRSISRGLTCLGVEARGKGICFSEESTRALKIIFVGSTSIHPETQALIADELDYPDRFIDSSVLLFRASELVLVAQHPSCPFSVFLLQLYHAIGLYVNGEQDAQGTNQHLYHRAAKETVGKA